MATAPFVLTVASEKGGVGKTTLATNLAVYLKALHEDLPVTVVSFDNHFSVDNMFAIGARPGRSVADLFAGVPAQHLVQLGEYGVQYLASVRTLHSPDADPGRLGELLKRSSLGGIFIIDTRPIIDYFTCSALLAADLILAPIKDRPSLVNAASLLQVLEDGAVDPARLWLVPSLIDARLRLREDIGVGDFLTFSARERGYQVVDTWIAKSPKVEGLATNLTSRVYPILTHARNTVVHQQYRELADFVMARYAAFVPPAITVGAALWLRRLANRCPCCDGVCNEEDALLWQNVQTRRKGLVHRDCLCDLLITSEVGAELPEKGMLAFNLATAGLSSPAMDVALQLFADDGEDQLQEQLALAEHPAIESFLRNACARAAADFYRDALLVALAPSVLRGGDSGRQMFAALRHRVLQAIFTEP
jgi:cellulose biosynthesis protein BcsQ